MGAEIGGSISTPSASTAPEALPYRADEALSTDQAQPSPIDPRLEAQAHSVEEALGRADRGTTRRADMLMVAETFKKLDADAANALFSRVTSDGALPRLSANLSATGAGRNGQFALGLDDRLAFVGDLASKLSVTNLLSLAQSLKGNWYRVDELHKAVAERSPHAVEYEQQAAAQHLMDKPTHIALGEGAVEFGLSAGLTGIGLVVAGPPGAGVGAGTADLLIQRAHNPNLSFRDFDFKEAAISGIGGGVAAQVAPFVAKGADLLAAGASKVLPKAVSATVASASGVRGAALKAVAAAPGKLAETAVDAGVEVGAEMGARLALKQEVRPRAANDLLFAAGVGLAGSSAKGVLKGAVGVVERVAEPMLMRRIDRVLSLSPTGSAYRKDLLKEGWTFDWKSKPGDPGWTLREADGSVADAAGYADYASLRIGIRGDLKWSPLDAVHTVLHEMGHAVQDSKLRDGMSTTFDSTTKQAYLRSRFEEEGVAELTTKLGALEIEQHGGPKLPRWHDPKTAAEMDKAVNRYLKDGDAAAARNRIGYLHTRGADGNQKWYPRSYGAFYDRDYPWRNLPADPTGRGPMAGPLRRASEDARGKAVLAQRLELAEQAPIGSSRLPRAIDGSTPVYIQVDSQTYGIETGKLPVSLLDNVDVAPGEIVHGVFASLVRPPSMPGTTTFAKRLGDFGDEVLLRNPRDRSRIQNEGGLMALCHKPGEVVDGLVRLRPGPRDAASQDVLRQHVERANENARAQGGDRGATILGDGDTKVYFTVSEFRLLDDGGMKGEGVSANVLQGRSGRIPDGQLGTLIEPIGPLRPGEHVVAVKISGLRSDTWFVSAKPGTDLARLYPDHFWVGFGHDVARVEIIRSGD